MFVAETALSFDFVSSLPQGLGTHHGNDSPHPQGMACSVGAQHGEVTRGSLRGEVEGGTDFQGAWEWVPQGSRELILEEQGLAGKVGWAGGGGVQARRAEAPGGWGAGDMHGQVTERCTVPCRPAPPHSSAAPELDASRTE